MYDYLQLIRAPGLFSAFSNILAAYFIGSWGNPVWHDLMLLLVTSACLYSAGMVLNDCYDIKEDRLERPGRPLASGGIPLRQGWWIGWTLLLAGIVVSTFVSLLTFSVALLLSGLIILYNARAKHGKSGPFVMGACRYMNWLLGLAPTLSSPLLLLLPLPLFCYITALTFLSRIETGRVEQSMVAFCAAGITASFFFVALLMMTGVLTQTWLLVPALACTLFLLYRLYQLRKTPSSLSVHSIMNILLLGIIPLDALMVMANGLWRGAIIILMLLAPSRLLARKMYVT